MTRLDMPCACGDIVLVEPSVRQTKAAAKEGVLLGGVHHRWSAPCFHPEDNGLCRRCLLAWPCPDAEVEGHEPL